MSRGRFVCSCSVPFHSFLFETGQRVCGRDAEVIEDTLIRFRNRRVGRGEMECAGKIHPAVGARLHGGNNPIGRAGIEEDAHGLAAGQVSQVAAAQLGARQSFIVDVSRVIIRHSNFIDRRCLDVNAVARLFPADEIMFADGDQMHRHPQPPADDEVNQRHGDARALASTQQAREESVIGVALQSLALQGHQIVLAEFFGIGELQFDDRIAKNGAARVRVVQILASRERDFRLVYIATVWLNQSKRAQGNNRHNQKGATYEQKLALGAEWRQPVWLSIRAACYSCASQRWFYRNAREQQGRSGWRE